MLLHGPPGTGKTLLARAAAADAGASFFCVSGPELVSSLAGESEAALAAVFAAAAAAAPAVVFLDELDAIAPSRSALGGGSAGAAAGRLLTTLLTLLDGQEDELRGVMVLAATNRPGAVDGAVRRPGRLDVELEVPVPTARARRGMLEAHLRPLRHSLQPEDVAAIAAASHGFVAADVGRLCQEAALSALRRAVAPVADGAAGAPEAAPPGSADEPAVTAADFRAAARVVRPSVLREVRPVAPGAAFPRPAAS